MCWNVGNLFCPDCVINTICMARRRRCTICGSHQWHKEPSSGLIACSEGHVLQDYRTESREVDELGAHGMRRRAVKSTRTKKDRTTADPKLYHGARGRFHYFQCQQLLLRKQIAALITLWKLPVEFEIVCRDIWTLHLSLLPDPPPAEPYHYIRESKGGASGFDYLSENEKGDIRTSSSSDGEEQAENPDSELESLLRLNSESDTESSSSSFGEDSQVRSKGQVKSSVRKRGRDAHAYDGPVSAVAVMVVACWTMRIPKLYMDFVRAIEAHELPYLDPLRLLPRELTLHLTQHMMQALSPPHAPQTLTLRALASRLARKMYETYGIRTPEANAAPILWRVIDELGGTPMLYVLAKILSDALSLPLTLHPSLAAPLNRARKRDPTRHKFDNVAVEVAFACVALVVLKMVYGLDGHERQPTNLNDPGCVFPRVEEYIAYLGVVETEEGKGRKPVMDGNRTTALDLSDDMMDDYLAFCEWALIGPGNKRDGEDRNSLLTRYFPLPEAQIGTGIRREVRMVRKEFSGTGVDERIEGDCRPRPGEEYEIHSSTDVLGSVSEELGLVIGRIGKVCGVEERYVMKVLETFEQRLKGRS